MPRDKKPALRDPLAARSLEVLRAGQSPSGAFIASPTFAVYRFAWLRDGAFVAHALDAVGERERAARFHNWAATAIERKRERVEQILEQLRRRERPEPEAMLPARYTLAGEHEEPDADPWPNFQLDGYGMWLWAVSEHLDRGIAPPLARAVDLVARYLQAAWQLPCWGCWEEYDDGEHACTLAAVAAGLDAAARLLGSREYETAAARVRERLLDRFVRDGTFIRCASDYRLDGSLLWLAEPFRVLPLADARVEKTIESVRRDLAGPGGGLYRYLGDTYYGGGQWLLLTCSLACVDALRSRRDEFERSRDWVRAQARENGDLPEQVTDHAQAPEMVEPWRKKWGEVATPLLWSHAMYLLTEVAAKEAGWSSSR